MVADNGSTESINSPVFSDTKILKIGEIAHSLPTSQLENHSR